MIITKNFQGDKFVCSFSFFSKKNTTSHQLANRIQQSSTRIHNGINIYNMEEQLQNQQKKPQQNSLGPYPQFTPSLLIQTYSFFNYTYIFTSHVQYWEQLEETTTYALSSFRYVPKHFLQAYKIICYLECLLL